MHAATEVLFDVCFACCRFVMTVIAKDVSATSAITMQS